MRCPGHARSGAATFAGDGRTEAPSPIRGHSANRWPTSTPGIVWASAAQADAASFLNDLNNVGIQDFAGGNPAPLQMGYKLCAQLSYSATPAQPEDVAVQRSDASRGPNGLNPKQAEDLINDTVSICVQPPNWVALQRNMLRSIEAERS
jgi:hypothetical protein